MLRPTFSCRGVCCKNRKPSSTKWFWVEFSIKHWCSSVLLQFAILVEGGGGGGISWRKANLKSLPDVFSKPNLNTYTISVLQCRNSHHLCSVSFQYWRVPSEPTTASSTDTTDNINKKFIKSTPLSYWVGEALEWQHEIQPKWVFVAKNIIQVNH